MSSIERVFANLKSEGKAALIGYIMAGDPDLSKTKSIAEALIRGGIDILELGIPFSDPIADGPTIQAASVRSLAAGTTPMKVLEIAKAVKTAANIPVAVMTYYNPIFVMGFEKFFVAIKNSHVDGIIIPDLPVEEAEEYSEDAQKFGVDTIFLAAPSTANERLEKIVKHSSGFLYLVSHFGVTGVKPAVEKSTLDLIRRVLPFTRDVIPLAVGFGVSTPEHVKNLISAGADGVIVGSVFVNLVKKNLKNPKRMVIELEKKARMFKDAT
jgi:tryptophan synthase alpha chain